MGRNRVVFVQPSAERPRSADGSLYGRSVSGHGEPGCIRRSDGDKDRLDPTALWKDAGGAMHNSMDEDYGVHTIAGLKRIDGPETVYIVEAYMLAAYIRDKNQLS